MSWHVMVVSLLYWFQELSYDIGRLPISSDAPNFTRGLAVALGSKTQKEVGFGTPSSNRNAEPQNRKPGKRSPVAPCEWIRMPGRARARGPDMPDTAPHAAELDFYFRWCKKIRPASKGKGRTVEG